MQRHEHVQRGFGPAAWVELVRLAARDRTDAAIAKPETSVCSRRRTLAAKFPGWEEARNRGYSPYSVETWRTWEYWANKAGCGDLLTRPDGGHAHPPKG